MSDATSKEVPYTDIIDMVMKSVRKAEEKHKPMNSALEGWAVIREEVDELHDELTELKGRIETPMWAAVKSDNYAAVMDEAKHVAAMALRFLHDVATCSGTQWRDSKPAEQGASSMRLGIERRNLSDRRSSERVYRPGQIRPDRGGRRAQAFNIGDAKMHVHIDGAKVAEAVLPTLENEDKRVIAALRATIEAQEKEIENAKRANDMMREGRDTAMKGVRSTYAELCDQRAATRRATEEIAACRKEVERIARDRDEHARSLREERQKLEMIHAMAAGGLKAIKVDMRFGDTKDIASAVAEAMKRHGVRW